MPQGKATAFHPERRYAKVEGSIIPSFLKDLEILHCVQNDKITHAQNDKPFSCHPERRYAKAEGSIIPSLLKNLEILHCVQNDKTTHVQNDKITHARNDKPFPCHPQRRYAKAEGSVYAAD
jgi:hypothetical protein